MQSLSNRSSASIAALLSGEFVTTCLRHIGAIGTSSNRILMPADLVPGHKFANGLRFAPADVRLRVRARDRIADGAAAAYLPPTMSGLIPLVRLDAKSRCTSRAIHDRRGSRGRR